MIQVEKWSVFEEKLHGPADGNPFVDYTLQGVFSGKWETVTVDGFYDGDGVYKFRFMPSFEGEYEYTLSADFLSEPVKGRFVSVEASGNNHGPVRVANTWHFAYEDGTPYYCLGTTCYVWALQSDERIRQTLRTLRESAFNKIRFCIFPKHYDYNLNEPRSYPYEGKPMDSSVLTPENFLRYNNKSEGNEWDFTRFNPEHFRHLEYCIQELGRLGIEADIIVMHPYDRWGFSCMTKEQDDLYWKYVLARFAAYRNVWWSLANEYDLLHDKTIADWERYAELICTHDPYGHLRSIHNCIPFYDYKRPWVTHCSIQRQDLYRTAENVNEWRERYGKPVVLDEIAYEGNIPHGWGNISGEEMLRRFWEAVCRGGYPGHGETFLNEEGVLWWSHGGSLHGESHKRFQFLLDIWKETPGNGLMPCEGFWAEVCAAPQESLPGNVRDYYLIYYSFMQPALKHYHMDDITEYRLKVIDTWNMTIEDRGIVKGRFTVELPGRPYMAIQLKRVEGEERTND